MYDGVLDDFVVTDSDIACIMVFGPIIWVCTRGNTVVAFWTIASRVFIEIEDDCYIQCPYVQN